MRYFDLFENDDDNWDALAKTGFWGRRAAGCIIYAQDTKRFCIAQRSEEVEEPHTWGTWGGAIDNREQPKSAALRELREETGYEGPAELIPLYVFKHKSGFQYFNFLAVVPTEFVPILDWETEDYSWVKYGKWPTPLHNGLKLLLQDPASINTIKSVMQNTK
jgi:8-oxo-dGTP pyrophosphatase MutT (NUDIX family)